MPEVKHTETRNGDGKPSERPSARTARVLIVDDSAIVRQVLQAQLSRQPGIEVVGTAADPFAAREKILQLKPDCVVLDIEMPRMDGLTFLKKLMKFHPVATIVCSSVTPKGCALAVECLEAGALEVVSKPGGSFSVGDVANRLAELIRASLRAPLPRAIAKAAAATDGSLGMDSAAATSTPTSTSTSTSVPTSTPTVHAAIGVRVAPKAPVVRAGLGDKLIAIGTSTGGTEALRTVLSQLPRDVPPILMVQHMPEGFTKAFADRLNGLCQIEVKEAEDGDAVIPGRALLAPGNRHMRLVRESGATSVLGAGRWIVRVADGPRVLRHKPSVEVLFESCAQYAGAKALGIIMTGMGNDGATGLLSMRKAGALTVGQDEASCVVYGMPREAALCGAVQVVSPLDRIARNIVDFTNGALTAQAA
jgi:two-component system chemotaxis response regulator CheB